LRRDRAANAAKSPNAIRAAPCGSGHRTGQLGRDETEHAGVLGIELAVEAASADDNAAVVDIKHDAVDYHKKAAEERHLQFQLTLTSLAVRHDEAVAVPTSRTGPVQKAAEVRDASPAFNDPKNKL
jgi:hypothetical protein